MGDSYRHIDRSRQKASISDDSSFSDSDGAHPAVKLGVIADNGIISDLDVSEELAVGGESGGLSEFGDLVVDGLDLHVSGEGVEVPDVLLVLGPLHFEL